ncbi:ImmA/IrrE family metallo-endopeptidase [Virgibacillus halophilus]
MKLIAKKLGVNITYDENKLFRLDNEVSLKKGSKVQEWIEFAHEVCHYLRHCGNQLNMHPLFRQLQEYQAEYFAYHFCVPTFMLDRLFNYTIRDIMNIFNVDYDFAVRRLEIYRNRHMNQPVIWFNR